jgi:peptidoglycan/LPS O-acetylase OafA/YrhL
VKRIPSLDGLRAISVSLVLVGHLARSGRTPHFLSVYAFSGVRMFFVISGYLITTILMSEHVRTSTVNLREFYIRRAYRILPAAGVFMTVATVLCWHELRWIDIGAMLLYLVNYDGGKPWMIGHLWSLGVEEQFYLLWPSALRQWYRYRVFILLSVVVTTPIFRAPCYHFHVLDGGGTTFLALADVLAIGCLLAIYGSRIPKINSWWAAAMLVAIVLIPYYPAISPLKTLFRLFVLDPIMNCTMAGLLLHAVRAQYRFLNIAPIVWLGQISYSLYLWQQPFFFAPPGEPAYKLVVGVGLACLSYYLVEKPVLGLREKRNIPRSSAHSGAPTGASVKVI